MDYRALSTKRIVCAVFLPHCLGDDLEELKPNAKVAQAIHLFTLAEYSCAFRSIITHSRVIIFTLRRAIERVCACKTPIQTPVAPDSTVYIDNMRVLCVFTTGASYNDAPAKPSKHEKFTLSPYHFITEVIIV